MPQVQTLLANILESIKNNREGKKTEYERLAREIRNSREEGRAEIASLKKLIRKISDKLEGELNRQRSPGRTNGTE
jgi:esterase/lipase